MLRLVALMNVRSHVILDAQLSPDRAVKFYWPKRSCDKFQTTSSILFDKGFWGADLPLSVVGGGANQYWLTPVRKNLVMEKVERYEQHDRLVRMKVSAQARKRDPGFSLSWEMREMSYESHGKVRSLLRLCPSRAMTQQL